MQCYQLKSSRRPSAVTGCGEGLSIPVFSLVDLPTEILVQIIQQLELRDKLQVSLVNKGLNFLCNVDMYRDLYLVGHGDRLSDTSLSACYDFARLNPVFFPHVEKIHFNGAQGEEEMDFDLGQCPMAVAYHHHNRWINISRSDSVKNRLEMLEIDLARPVAAQEQCWSSLASRLRKLSISGSGSGDLDRGVLRCDELQELDLQDDPWNLRRFQLDKLTCLKLCITDKHFQYEQFWELLDSRVNLGALEKLEINFKATCNLSEKAYVIDVTTLAKLAEINEFLLRVAPKLVSLKELGLVVEDDRHVDNAYKKTQPDLNTFLMHLPAHVTLSKLSIKLSNEFTIKQLEQLLSPCNAEDRVKVESLIFFGNLDSSWIPQQYLYCCKMNMARGAVLMKDYSLYGKFQRHQAGAMESVLLKEFAELSTNWTVDYLCSDYVVRDYRDFKLTAILQESLSAKKLSLKSINLNGLIYGIDQFGTASYRC